MTWSLTMAQMGFFDLSDRYVSLDAKRDPLVEIDAVVPWEEFRPVLERVWRKPEAKRKSHAGRRPWDAVVMSRSPSSMSGRPGARPAASRCPFSSNWPRPARFRSTG
jgi:hypothetical protein